MGYVGAIVTLCAFVQAHVSSINEALLSLFFKYASWFAVRKGDRIAQLICERIYLPELQEEEVSVGMIFIAFAKFNTNSSRAIARIGKTLHKTIQTIFLPLSW